MQNDITILIPESLVQKQFQKQILGEEVLVLTMLVTEK